MVLQHHQQRVLEDRLLDLAVKSADHREVQVNPDPSPGGESAKTTHRFEGPPIFPAVGPKPEAGFRETGVAVNCSTIVSVFASCGSGSEDFAVPDIQETGDS